MNRQHIGTFSFTGGFVPSQPQPEPDAEKDDEQPPVAASDDEESASA